MMISTYLFAMLFGHGRPVNCVDEDRSPPSGKVSSKAVACRPCTILRE